MGIPSPKAPIQETTKRLGRRPIENMLLVPQGSINKGDRVSSYLRQEKIRKRFAVADRTNVQSKMAQQKEMTK